MTLVFFNLINIPVESLIITFDVLHSKPKVSQPNFLTTNAVRNIAKKSQLKEAFGLLSNYLMKKWYISIYAGIFITYTT